MKCFIFIVFFFLQFGVLQAQNEYNVWYFGKGAGLDFNSGTAVPRTDGKLYSHESSSSICDKNGNLLFYTNGDTIWNRNHQRMLNWEPSTQFLTRFSAMQGSIVLPVPGSSHLYYIIMGQSQFGVPIDSMVRYWTIDMNGDGGLGEVVEKEKPLYSMPLESFGVAQHANKQDFWVGAIESTKGNFKCIRTVNGQFTAPPNLQILPGIILYGHLNNKFSPDSKIFSARVYLDGQSNIHFDLYKFDNLNGVLTDRIQVPIPGSFGQYLEFSPDSRFLYCHNRENSSIRKWHLIQYDLSIWDSSAIAGSRTIIYSNPLTNFRGEFRGFQIGPDKRIYAFHDDSKKISIIDEPNKKGGACNYKHLKLDISPRSTLIGCPYYPAFRFKGVNLGKDTILCIGDSLQLDSRYEKALWNTGDSSRQIWVTEAGTYWVKNDFGQTDTIDVMVGKKFRVFLGSDTAFCHQFSHLLKAGSGAKGYQWNTGEIVEQITANAKGEYWVKVTDSNNCPVGDTILIDEIKKPEISLQYDSVTCAFTDISVKRIFGLNYKWNTGDTSVSIRVFKKGTYILTASHKFCSNSDTLILDKLPRPEFDLGPDRNYCENLVVLKTDEVGKYSWNTGEIKPSIRVAKPGIYWLSVTRNGCSFSDTILISPCEDMTWFIPDAFSPNGDGINDVFKIHGTNIKDIQMEIYNRWGERISVSAGVDASWDGIYKDAICQEGVYFYVLSIKGGAGGTVITKYLSGSFTLIK